ALFLPIFIPCYFAEEDHILTEYHPPLETVLDNLSAVLQMVTQTSLPVLVTTFTTVLGFGSLITSDITMLIQFGYASALGLTANYIVTVVGLPIMLLAWRVPAHGRQSTPHAPSGRDTGTGWIEWLAAFNLRYRPTILVVAGLAPAGSLVGWFTLRVNTDFVSYFPRNSVIRQRAEDLHRSMAGAFNFFVVVDSHRENGIVEPGMLERVA